MFRVMELFSHLSHDLIPLEVERDPMSTYATQDAKHQSVSLLFVNKAATGQFVQIASNKNLFGASPWHNLNVNIPGYSIVVLTLHRNAGAEAYSFAVPTDNDANTAPIIHTVCGTQTNTAVNATIC
jgi:hypothetical protein